MFTSFVLISRVLVATVPVLRQDRQGLVHVTPRHPWTVVAPQVVCLTTTMPPATVGTWLIE